MAELTDGLAGALVSVVGRDHVLVDADVTAGYAVDWTGRYRGSTPAVVRPATTEELAEVMALLYAGGVAVVPQGGNTGMVGGSVPLSGEVVVSTRRMDTIGEIDRLAAQVTCGAGVVLSDLHRAVEAAGYAFGVDLGARDSCTVGGMIATNAGGMHVIRYGPMRSQVMGIEAVLADGTVVEHLGGLLKDNTGYDMAGMFTGSEGTLGIVTRARVRLRPKPVNRVVAMCGCPDPAAVVAAAAVYRDNLSSLYALEMVLGSTVDLVSAHLGRRPPVGGHSLLIVEAAGPGDPIGELAAVTDLAADAVLDVAVATDERGAADLFAFRERVTEAVNVGPPPHKLDVTLPSAAIARFVDDVPGVVEAAHPGARVYLFGHVGDGNVHVNLKPPDGADHLPDSVDGIVLELVASRGGSISAEHGIGSAKREWLHLNRSAAEIEVFRRLKQVFDPAGILNPGVLIPDPATTGSPRANRV